jgi:hypothetical protein
MSDTETTPPAFFKAPTFTAPAEVLKALLVYQRAEAAHDEAQSAFKRTKAGRIKDADREAELEVQRTFYRDAHASWKTIDDWIDECQVTYADVYYQGMMTAFLAYAGDHQFARYTKTIKGINDLIDERGGHIARLFAGHCTPHWVNVTFGDQKYMFLLRLNRAGVEAVEYYQQNDEGKPSGWPAVTGRLAYKHWEERFYKPQVRIANEECSPTEAESVADATREAAVMASLLADFTNNAGAMDFDYHEHKKGLIKEALTVSPAEIDEPNNPDAE